MVRSLGPFFVLAHLTPKSSLGCHKDKSAGIGSQHPSGPLPHRGCGDPHPLGGFDAATVTASPTIGPKRCDIPRSVHCEQVVGNPSTTSCGSSAKTNFRMRRHPSASGCAKTRTYRDLAHPPPPPFRQRHSLSRLSIHSRVIPMQAKKSRSSWPPHLNTRSAPRARVY